jgi:hypothetical protein
MSDLHLFAGYHHLAVRLLMILVIHYKNDRGLLQNFLGVSKTNLQNTVLLQKTDL